MKKSKIFSVVFSLLFISAQIAFSQIADVKPDLQINCPTERVPAAMHTRLTTTIKPDTDANAIYNWTVLNGIIASGQGTKDVEIKPDENAESVTATVEVSGVYFEVIRADCVFQLFEKPKPRQIDDFRFSAQGELKARLDSYFKN